MSEPRDSLRDRETSAIMSLCKIADSLRFTAPEGIAAKLYQAQNLLNHHFAESIARADVPYVVKILRKIDARKRHDPEFAAALAEYPNQEDS